MIDDLTAEERPPPQHRICRADREEAAREVEQASLPLVQIPVDPAGLIVLAVGVVVATLRARKLVTERDHRHALRQGEGRQDVAHGSIAGFENGRIARRPLDPPVATEIVARAVLVVFAVRLVLLLLVTDQIVEGEAIVRRDEVDARVRGALGPLVDVGGAGEA